MVSLKWIKQQETLLSYTRPGPERDALAASIAAAKEQRVKEEAEFAPLKRAGFVINQYAGRCFVSGVAVAAGEGVARQEKTMTGPKWRTYCLAEARKIAEK